MPDALRRDRRQEAALAALPPLLGEAERRRVGCTDSRGRPSPSGPRTGMSAGRLHRLEEDPHAPQASSRPVRQRGGDLALFVALGGTAYAVNTVGSADIIDGEVKSVDIGNNEIGSRRRQGPLAQHLRRPQLPRRGRGRRHAQRTQDVGQDRSRSSTSGEHRQLCRRTAAVQVDHRGQRPGRPPPAHPASTSARHLDYSSSTARDGTANQGLQPHRRDIDDATHPLQPARDRRPVAEAGYSAGDVAGERGDRAQA